MKLRSKKISLKWKIFATFELFAIILIAVLWLFQVVYLKNVYVYIKELETERIMDEVNEVMASSNSKASDLTNLASEENVAINVTDTSGNSVYSAEYNPSGQLNAMPLEVFEEYYNAAREAGGETKIIFEGRKMMDNPQVNMDMVPMDNRTGFVQNRGNDMAQSVIYVRIISTTSGDYVLMVNSVLTPVDATVHTIKFELMVVTVVVLVVALVLAWISSRAISKSLVRLNNSAQELAHGNYDISFNEQDYKEINQLSETLNYAADELSKTENLRRELIANVSHDLRTPLTMIKAYSEVMRDLPGENNPENVQVVIDETERLTNLVNDMLDVSKLEAGAIELDCHRYNLTESIREVLQRYNKLVEQEGYTIDFKYDREIEICADEGKMNQVIYNLVNNAINYTGDNKRVNVVQTVHNSSVKIEIIDSGVGIAPKDLPYVWDRYYKVDKAHKRAVMGTGLGLSIVKKVLEMHGATYGVDSNPGQGSNFWFVINIDGE
ncbi:MAG: HAMP domain-containing histidine kinase [Lachnospiraceae bacterium]|nr:HAMP domain-containing histidine kinase [Lachnospiraceae bacterium]